MNELLKNFENRESEEDYEIRKLATYLYPSKEDAQKMLDLKVAEQKKLLIV